MAQNVLITIDGSETSLAALRVALGTVGPGAHFVVAEVIDPIDRVSDLRSAAFDPEIVTSALQALHGEAEARLATARDELAKGGASDIETAVLGGRAGDAIVAYATEGGFDLVVMGTHGRSGPARTFLGSVAEHVVRHLRGIPVLLIHPAEDD